MNFDKDTPKHVVLFTYDPKSKQHERYDALVIGVRDFENHDYPVLNLVTFRHNDIALHHALMGVDWADTLERTLDVPHQDDLEQQSFYYLFPWEEGDDVRVEEISTGETSTQALSTASAGTTGPVLMSTQTPSTASSGITAPVTTGSPASSEPAASTEPATASTETTSD